MATRPDRAVMSQLPFSLHLSPSYQPADYVVTESNQLAYDWAMRWPHWPSYGLWLYGEEGSGKSHLAHIWADRADAAIISPPATDTDPAALFGGKAALLIDGSWERLSETALFHLLNHAKEAGKHLLILHRQPVQQAAFALPDLRSRLLALPSVALQQPDETLLRAVMMKQLADRQMSVESEVIAYLLTHTDRSFQAVSEQVARLDAASLQHQRKITLPFVRQLLSNHS